MGKAKGGIPAGGSFFRKRLGECRAIWLLSAGMALLCTLISYPGIFYSDSYVRAATGGAVLNAVVKTLQGRPFVLETNNAFTVIPSFFMAFSLGVTGNVALYTFCQAFACFAAVLLLIRETGAPGHRALGVLFAVCPLIYGASVYFEANVGSFAGIAALILLMRRLSEEKTRGDRILEFCLIAFASFVTFGYRTNAVTVLPVLLVYLWKTQRTWIRRLLPVLALVCGLILVWTVPALFGVRSESNASTGFIWEMATMIQRMKEEDRAGYLDYLDDICGEGATRGVLAESDETSANSFMWGSAVNTARLSEPGATGRVLGKYLRLMTERPGEWFSVKKDFMLRAMGFGEALDISEYDYNRWDAMAEYGFNDSRQRRLFHRSYLKFNEIFGFYTRRPWLPFLISLGMLIAEYLRKSRNRGLHALLFWTAVFYYGAYLAVIVSFELRFFYPALVLLAILDCAVCLEWIRDGIRFLRRGPAAVAERGEMGYHKDRRMRGGRNR